MKGSRTRYTDVGAHAASAFAVLNTPPQAPLPFFPSEVLKDRPGWIERGCWCSVLWMLSALSCMTVELVGKFALKRFLKACTGGRDDRDGVAVVIDAEFEMVSELAVEPDDDARATEWPNVEPPTEAVPGRYLLA